MLRCLPFAVGSSVTWQAQTLHPVALRHATLCKTAHRQVIQITRFNEGQKEKRERKAADLLDGTLSGQGQLEQDACPSTLLFPRKPPWQRSQWSPAVLCWQSWRAERETAAVCQVGELYDGMLGNLNGSCGFHVSSVKLHTMDQLM